MQGTTSFRGPKGTAWQPGQHMVNCHHFHRHNHHQHQLKPYSTVQEVASSTGHEDGACGPFISWKALLQGSMSSKCVLLSVPDVAFG